MSNSNKTKDFALTLDFAKKISMMAKTDKGGQARNYFLECEKKASKPLSQIELIIQSDQVLAKQEKEIREHDNRLSILEAKQVTSPEYHTIAAFGTIHNMPVNNKIAKVLGLKARKVCKDQSLLIDKVRDIRWVFVNAYPKKVSTLVFDNNYSSLLTA